jgi:hypothetical protein
MPPQISLLFFCHSQPESRDEAIFSYHTLDSVFHALEPGDPPSLQSMEETAIYRILPLPLQFAISIKHLHGNSCKSILLVLALRGLKYDTHETLVNN